MVDVSKSNRKKHVIHDVDSSLVLHHDIFFGADMEVVELC
jgi:hypothetical protein